MMLVEPRTATLINALVPMEPRRAMLTETQPGEGGGGGEKQFTPVGEIST